MRKNWTVRHALVNAEMDFKTIPEDENEKMDNKNDDSRVLPCSRTSAPQSLIRHDNHVEVGMFSSFRVHLERKNKKQENNDLFINYFPWW